MLSITVSSVESRGHAWNDANRLNRHDARIEQCGCLTNRSIHSKCCWENRLGEMETEPNLSWICWVCWAWFRQNNSWEFDGISVNSVIRLTVCKSIFSPMCAFSSIWNFCWKLLQYQTRCLLVPPSIVIIASFSLCQAEGNRLLQPNSQLNASLDACWSSLLSCHVPDVAKLICFDAKTMQLNTRSNASLGPEQLLTAGDSRSHSRTVGDTWWQHVTTTNDHLLLVPRSAFLHSCFPSGHTWIILDRIIWHIFKAGLELKAYPGLVAPH